MKKQNVHKPTLGNKIGLGLRMAANFAAYAGMTVVHAAQAVRDELRFQAKEIKLGVTGVDTTRNHKRR